MNDKKVLIIQDFSMSEEAVRKYDFLKEYGAEISVVQDAHNITKDEFMNRFLAFETQGPDSLPVNEEMVEKMRDADIVISHFSPISSRAIEEAEHLEAICILRSGVENVNLKTASKKGVKVTNAPGRLAVVVSEFTVGMICAETKNIARAHANMMKGHWENQYANSSYAATLGKRKIGLVGYGTIGTRVARMMESFGCEILIYDPYTSADKIREDGYQPVELNELCCESDVISIHYRLTPETKNMIGKEQFQVMKPHAFLINTARAGLVDEDCLLDALENHKIGGAALDVFHEEPLSPDSPYLKMDNVTLTPHIAGTASNSDELTFDIMEHALRHYFETGEWIHVVN